MNPLPFRALRAFMVVLLMGTMPIEAAKMKFSERELFRIPFGNEKTALGAKVEAGNFLIPRDFSRDLGGHIYINDSNKHRIVRFSPAGQYELSLEYPASAHQVFAQPDGLGNLWLLISDPTRGFYYGVYDSRGKRLREGVFIQYNHFRLHVDDARVLHVILSHSKRPSETHLFYLDQETFLLKKVKAAKPPEEHHRITHLERSYYIDPVPSDAKTDADRRTKITDDQRESEKTIKGRVVYVTDQNEIYTRVGDCQMEIYNLEGSHKGSIKLEGLPSACASARFDPEGNIYLLDGIRDASDRYSPEMPGMRLLVWVRDAT
jgi:hypothetical protein